MQEQVSVNDSILASVKKILGITDDNTEFDVDLIIYINTVLASLIQMGVGPQEGYVITDRENTWYEFTGGNKKIEMTKSYVALRVRKLFDPPQSSVLMEALNQEMDEAKWRAYIEMGGH